MRTHAEPPIGAACGFSALVSCSAQIWKFCYASKIGRIVRIRENRPRPEPSRIMKSSCLVCDQTSSSSGVMILNVAIVAGLVGEVLVVLAVRRGQVSAVDGLAQLEHEESA